MEKLYYIKSLEDSQLEKQLRWARKELLDTEKNNAYFALNKGEVYECFKSANKKCFIVVLNKTEPEESRFLACPIYPYSCESQKSTGIDIGIIPEISFHYNFIAAIHEIHFIDKADVICFNKTKYPLFVCNLPDFVLSNILINYKKLIEFALKDNKRSFKYIHNC